MKKTIKYTEPNEYFPKSIRDKHFGKAAAKPKTDKKPAAKKKAK